MSLLDFTLPGSDPSNPNSFVQTPQQVAYQQELARQLMSKGSDYSPVQSTWQGLARMTQGLVGGLEMGQAQRTQRAGLADALASYGNSPQVRALGYDPTEANIPDTPGQTTPALQANDRLVDQLSDAQDGTQPAGGGAPSGGVNTALAAALTAHGSPGASAPAQNPMALAAALGAGTPYGAPTMNGAPGATPGLAGGTGALGTYGPAISKMESGGNYGALGPQTSSGDRAYGKYQVMGANIPAWTQAALGRSLTPQQFLASPQAQDAVFNHQFGQYVQKYGPQNAASMWLTGRTLANGGAGATDQNGTSGQAYADQFTRNLGAAPASQAIAQATGSAGSPSWADVQADAQQGDAFIASQEAKNGTGAPSSASAFAPGASSGASSPPANAGAPSPADATLSRSTVSGSPSPVAIGALRTAMAQPTPAFGSSGSGQPAQSPSPSASPTPTPFPAAPNGAHGDITALMNVLNNPWSTPAMQQVASTLLQAHMPSPPTIVDGPPDEHGLPTKFLLSKTQGILGRLNSDGTVTPVGAGGGAGASSSNSATTIPPGADAKTYREELARRDAAITAPSTEDVKGMIVAARADPAYREADAATGAYNSMLEEAKYNNHASDKTLIDAFAKINNPGRAVGVGQYTINSDLQSLPEAIRGEALKAYNGGGVLSNSTRAAIIQLARQRVDAYQASWENARAPFVATAKRGNLPDFAVPDLLKPKDANLGDIGRYSVQADGVHDSKRNGSLVDPRTLKPIGGATASASSGTASGQPQQQQPAPDARLAPDGHWYRPDPARPGKYLRLN
jgi:hypothetical protein